MNREFLKKIKQKLQVGNTRSIHLNSYPGRYSARLDLYDINSVKQGSAGEFLKKLLSQSSFAFKLKLDENYISDISFVTNSSSRGEPSPEHTENVPVSTQDREIKKQKQLLLNKRLTTLFYEYEDTYLEHGVKSFGFGFPTLIYRAKQDPEKILSAPVFIWMLDLARDKNEWIISRDEDHGITVNDVLLNYLEQDLETTGFFKINDEILSDSLLDENEYTEIINKLLKQINSASVPFTAEYDISPMKDKINREISLGSNLNPHIINSGIFGLFKSPKEPLIKDIKLLLSKTENENLGTPQSKAYQDIQYSAVETDPAQENALKSLKDNDKLIIHGPPGTGKSQTLTAIIVNALFNKAKCLVVCEKRTALEVIQKNLEMLGLGRLCGLIEDVNRDRKKIVDSVREPKAEINTVNETILNEIFNETDNSVSLINSNHSFYGKYLLNDMTWSDIAGNFLQNENNGENYLNLFENLKDCGIDFCSNDISVICNSVLNEIRRNRSLYKTAKSDLEKFKLLNDTLFTGRSAKDVVIELNSGLKKYSDELSAVLEQLNKVNNKYSDSLKQSYIKFNEDLSGEIEELNRIYRANTDINKHIFCDISGWAGFKLGFLSIFSGKYRNLKKDKALIKEKYDLLNRFKEPGYIEMNYDNNLISPEQIISSAAKIQHKLTEWYRNINEYQEKNLRSYSSSNYDKYAFKEPEIILIAVESTASVLSNINNSRYFKEKLNSKIGSIFSGIEQLENLKSNIDVIIRDSDCLYDYFHWRSNYVSANEYTRKIADELIKTDSDDWADDTNKYFQFNILLSNEKNIRLRDDSLYEVIKSNIRKISDYQLNIIHNYWSQRQKESAKKLEERTGVNINALYNKSRNSRFQKRNSLRKIIASDFGLFTDHFPVMLANPVVCSSLFEMREGMFDLVIFDESSQLRVEDVYAAKLRGRYKIVSGDENQMPPSSYFASSQVLIDTDMKDEEEGEISISQDPQDLADAESLLEFAERRGYERSFLEIHYRSKHPDLIDFSNAAFYGLRLNPMPPAVNYKAIRYFNVCGIYNQTEGVNKQEAEKVISLINELIDPSKGEGNPSIGIATFNIFQRNYILDMINNASNVNPDFAAKIDILRNKPGEPFFVKNLENIQGDERDIIIISTTFGKKADGSFLQNFGPVNQEKGYRLLNVIITRAKHMMIVCTSIPDEYVKEYPTMIQTSGNKGKGIFYAYLAYAKSIEDYDQKTKSSILSLVASQNEADLKSSHQNNRSLFENTVYDMLLQHYPAERVVKNYSTGGFMIDIAVLPQDKSGKIIAIECDGNNNHNSEQAYAWDIFREKYLLKFGYRFIRIWSVNWWNNPKRELERLINFINDTEESSQIIS